MVEIVVGNTISKIEGEVSSDLTHHLEHKLSYLKQGAQFSKLYKQKIWDGRIKLYKSRTQTFPTGLVSLVIGVMQQTKTQYKLIDIRVRPQATIQPPWIYKHSVRDYQQPVIDEAVKVGRGVVELATGGGKSIVYMGIIHRIGVRTLLVVNTKDALRDMADAANKCFGPDWFGMMGNGHKKQGALVTIITAKTAANQPDEFFRGYEALIIDEYHRAASTEYMNTITKMDVFYKIGGTGTNFRGDGKDLVLQALTGKSLGKIKATDLQDEGFLEKASIKYINNGATKISDLMFSDYKEIYDAGIIYNEERNDLILELVKKHLDDPKFILINNIVHGEILLERIKKIDPEAKYVDGDSKKALREQVKDDLVSGKQKTVVSSTIFNESIDIPRLEIAILAAGGKSGIQIIQRLGRILRKHSDKKQAILYDFTDNHSVKLHSHSLARMKVLRKEGHEVEIVDIENI